MKNTLKSLMFLGCLSLLKKDDIAFPLLSFLILDPKSESFLWNLLHLQVLLCSWCYKKSYWKCVLAIFNFFVSHFDFICLKRWAPIQTCKTNDSSWPNIDFIWMSNRSLYNLWCNVVRCSAHCSFLLICKF